MSSDPDFDHESSAEGFIQRAELMAGLGCYEDAAQELGSALTLDPGHLTAWVVLARVRLAADQPAEALKAADTAIAMSNDRNASASASPPGSGLLGALVTRGLALTDLRRFGEVTHCADELIRLGPTDGYAQRSAAALLAEARNGQLALNTAWRAVQLAPADPDSHLVLSLVAVRLGLFDLAERAYREGLQLDPELARAREEVGVVRLERQRYATALEKLLELTVPAETGPGPAANPVSPATQTQPVSPVSPDRPAGPINERHRQLLLFGAGYGIVAAVLVAFMAAGNVALSRFFAGLVAIGGLLLVWRLAARVAGPLGGLPRGLNHPDRAVALAGYAVLAAPVLIMLYALVGTPWPLVLALLAAGVAELVAFRRPVG